MQCCRFELFQTNKNAIFPYQGRLEDRNFDIFFRIFLNFLD